MSFGSRGLGNPFGTVGASNHAFPFGETTTNVVALAPNMDKDAITTGRVRPTLITAEPQHSVNLLIDGKDRIHTFDTPFHFSIDLGAPLARARFATVQRVILPLLNNVTPQNNRVRCAVYDATEGGGAGPFTPYYVEVELQPAIYDPASLSNALAAGLNASLGTLGAPLAGSAAVFIVTFDPVVQSFAIELQCDLVGGEDFRFQLDQDCTFVTRGRFFAGFSGVALDPATVLSTAARKWRGGRAGMVYSRFITIHSQQLTQYSYARSRTSDPLQGTDIIAIVDVTGLYNAGNFNVTVPFSGVYNVVETPEAPKIGVLNPSGVVDRYVDFFAKDEYGFGMDAVMSNVLTTPYSIAEEDPDDYQGATFTSPNTLGMSIWLEVFF